MAEKGLFFDAEVVDGDLDRVYDSDDWAAIFDAFLVGSDGVVEEYMDGLVVIETTPETMGVIVQPGAAFHSGRAYKNTADVNLDIDPNASGSTRVDLVVVQFDLDARLAQVTVHLGTPGAGVPDPTETSTIQEVPLAEITVANGEVEITTTEINDARTFLRVPPGGGGGGSTSTVFMLMGG